MRRFWVISQYTSEVIVPLCSRNSIIVDLGRRKWRWAAPCLMMLQESGVFMILKETLKCDPHIQFLLIASESLRNPTKRTLYDNVISRELLFTLFQRLYTPSTPIFTVWHCSHFSLSRPPCRWDRPWWLWLPGLVNQTFAACLKTGTPFFLWLVVHTVIPVNGQHPAINSGHFNIFSCQKLDNASLLLTRRILPYEHHLVLILRQLDSTHYYSLWWTCILGSTVKIPISSLDIWLSSTLGAETNMLTATLLQRFVPFHLNTPCNKTKVSQKAEINVAKEL